MWLTIAVPLTFLVLIALIFTWRRPALGLGVLAVGLAFHNAAIMLLLSVATPSLVIRGLQAWKEILLGLAIAKVVSKVGPTRGVRIADIWSKMRSSLWRASILDAVAIAFTALLVLYLALPFVSEFGTGTTLAQRLLSFRIFAMIPLLYALGRMLGVPDRRGTEVSVDLVILAAAAVAVFGLIELWFVRTRFWLDFGINQFTSWQGYAPLGPQGLPENFFQSTNEGLGLRRMVSTYLSPLGIAYTALLVLPMIAGALVAVRRTRATAWLALGLVLISIALSVTRLALLCLLVEAALWVMLTRRPPALVAGVFAVAAVSAAFWIYPRFGPLLTSDLVDVRPPAGVILIQPPPGVDEGDGARPSPAPSAPVAPDIVGRILTQQDASIQNHIVAVRDGLIFAIQHPLGVGLGSTMPRFGTPTGPAESAFLGIVGELGLIGGALFASLYGGVILIGLRLVLRIRERPFLELAMLVGIGGIGLAPIVMTSAVWSNLSVTFLFWWAAGATVSVADQGARRPFESHTHLGNP